MIRLALVIVVTLSTSMGLARAQEQAARDCFSVVVPPAVAGGQSSFVMVGLSSIVGSVLINRCTGQTWMLAKGAVSKGSVAYRWYPIASGAEEATFAENPK